MFNQKFKKAVDRWAGYVPQVLLSLYVEEDIQQQLESAT